MQKITLSRKKLAAALLFAATKDVRYYLNGVNLECYASRTIIVATDGHCLAALNDQPDAENEMNGQHCVSLILPSHVCEQFKVTSRTLYDTLTLTVDGENCSLSDGTATVSFKPVDGRFPDFRRVIPSTVSGEVAQFDSELLARFGKAAKILTPKRKTYGLIIGHNGTGSASVEIGESDFRGVIMPMRLDGPTSRPEWVDAPRAPETVAETEETAAPETAAPGAVETAEPAASSTSAETAEPAVEMNYTLNSTDSLSGRKGYFGFNTDEYMSADSPLQFKARTPIFPDLESLANWAKQNNVNLFLKPVVWTEPAAPGADPFRKAGALYSCVSTPAGWQTRDNRTGQFIGPAFNSCVQLWDWQGENRHLMPEYDGATDIVHADETAAPGAEPAASSTSGAPAPIPARAAVDMWRASGERTAARLRSLIKHFAMQYDMSDQVETLYDQARGIIPAYQFEETA